MNDAPLPVAKAVAATGKIYAVDIQQDLLNYIDKRNTDENIRNVKAVLGEYDDPKIPAHDVDLAFINDVLHHIDEQAQPFVVLVEAGEPFDELQRAARWSDAPLCDGPAQKRTSTDSDQPH